MDFLRYEKDMKSFLTGISYSNESIAPYLVKSKKYLQEHEFGDVKEKSLDEILNLLSAYMDVAISYSLQSKAQKADEMIAKAWEVVDIAREIYPNDANLHIAKMIIYNNDIVNIINHGSFLDAMSSLDSIYKFYKAKPEGDYDHLFLEFDYQILTLWIKYYALDSDMLNVGHSSLVQLYEKLDNMDWLDSKTKARLIVEICYFMSFCYLESDTSPYLAIYMCLLGLDKLNHELKDSNLLDDFENQIKLTHNLGELVKQVEAYEVIKDMSNDMLLLAEKAIKSDDIDVQLAMHDFCKVMGVALDKQSEVDAHLMRQIYQVIGYGQAILIYREKYQDAYDKLQSFINKSPQILAKCEDKRIKLVIALLYHTCGELAYKLEKYEEMDQFSYQCYLLRNENEIDDKTNHVKYENLTYLSENAQRLSHQGYFSKAKDYYQDIFRQYEAMELIQDNLINYRHFGIDTIDLARIYIHEENNQLAIEALNRYLAFSNLFKSKVDFDEYSYYQCGRVNFIKAYLLIENNDLENSKLHIDNVMDLAMESESKFKKTPTNWELQGLANLGYGLMEENKSKARDYFNKASMIFNLSLKYMDVGPNHPLMKYRKICQEELAKIDGLIWL